MEIDPLLMAHQLWDAIILGLNFMIPIAMPDGTKIGAVIFFAVLGIIVSIFGGKKISDVYKKIFDDLTM